MASKPLKLAIIAGEPSGDRLGADLIREMRARLSRPLHVVGVGGDAMQGEGLSSLFDYSELSIVGIGAVVARLPQLVARIHQTARAIVAEKPDILVIVDSPDFTHRVARRVRRELPRLPVVDYVSPTVWAWKPERAAAMRGYVDHVLCIFPFEPEVLDRLQGPPSTYVGHRLARDAGVLTAQARQAERRKTGELTGEVLLLPGSRTREIARLLPIMRHAASELHALMPAGVRFSLPTVARHHATVEKAVAEWPVDARVIAGEDGKAQAFASADVAIAASGTVLLELALSGVPCISIYKLDPLARAIMSKVTTWSAALPNLIAGYPVIPEYLNDSVRANRLARHAAALIRQPAEREAMLVGFDAVREVMAVDIPPGEHAASIVIDLIGKSAGRA